MGKIIINSIIILASLLNILHAQGTITYLSNLGQTPSGSAAVGSNSWLAAIFSTGNNTGGYTLNSVQLEMTDALGNPDSFMALLYSATISGPLVPGSDLGTLNGSLNPDISGIYTFTPGSNLTLLPNTRYYIVLTAGTAIANNAYEWSLAGANSYNLTGGWSTMGGALQTSNDGSSWSLPVADDPEYAINATAIPEPDILGLFALGSLGFLWQRRK